MGILISNVAIGQSNQFQIGVHLGPFIPQNTQVQGLSQVSYVDGSPVSAFSVGFGNGFDLSLNGAYYFSDLGVQVRSGIRILQNELRMSLAPDGDIDSYENTLTVFPNTISFVNRFSPAGSRVIPYMGIGFGIYFTEWEEKHFPENATRTWMKGSAMPVGIHFLTGFSCPLYGDLFFTGNLEYSFASTDMKVKNADNNDEREIRDLNIGGMTISLGLAFSL